MKQRRKDYRVAKPPERLLGQPGDLIVNFLDASGALTQSFDFSVHASRPIMAAELAFAFRNHLAEKSEATRSGTFKCLRQWFRFLDAQARSGDAAASMVEVDISLINAFIAWLNRRPISKGTRHRAWSSFKQLVAWLQRHRPDLMHPELELPFNTFPRRSAETRPREALSKAELAAVLAACRTDIDASWRTFREGREALARVDCQAVATETDLRRLDLDDLGVLLAILTGRYGGLVPQESVTMAKGMGLGRLRRAILSRGGCSAVARFLHATPETLVPYMIAIAAQTFANPEALRLMRRDCMSEHVLLEGRAVVTWTKGRSNRLQRRSFLRDKSFSVPHLIDRVLALTEPLIPHVASSERELLFLCGNVRGGSRSVGVISQDLMIRHVRSFADRHGLTGANGKPLALAFANLRPTGLTLAYIALGHDVLKTQVLANHASPDTTRRYVDRPVVRAAQAIELGRLQARFVTAIRSGDLSLPSKRGDPSPITSAQNATASGFICADPLAGIAPGQSKGKLCTAWLGCFTCPNAVIPLEADTLARLLRMRDALSEARARLAPDRWRLFYAPKLEILERDVLPRFSTAMHAITAERLATTPPVPPVE
jgi:Phage integrase SAM-like domain